MASLPDEWFPLPLSAPLFLNFQHAAKVPFPSGGFAVGLAFARR